MPLQIGDVLLDKYRLEALIGGGAFGEVYRVTHLSLNVPRAIKILRRDAPGIGSSEFNDCRSRFQFEAQLGARLNTPVANPHLLQVHDFYEKGKLLLLEMEYAFGGSLAERLEALKARGESMPVGDVVQMGIEVAEGLSALHKLDIVHRDLKPSNILFGQDGHAKVADLGLAQMPGGPSQRTMLGQDAPPHPGTPAYMSPEQRNSRDYLPPASDVYALGLVLFEALTGRMYRSQRPGTRAINLRPEVPVWLDELLVRMLAEDPKDRPWDGAEAAELLKKGLVEEKARQKEEAARQEAEEKTRQPEQEKLKQAAEEQARQENEIRKKREIEEQARRIVEEQVRQEGEVRSANVALPTSKPVENSGVKILQNEINARNLHSDTSEKSSSRPLAFQPPQINWKFLSWWVLANTFGLFVGWLATFLVTYMIIHSGTGGDAYFSLPFSLHGDKFTIVELILSWIPGGILLGLFQWLVLKRFVKPDWIFFTFIGWVMGLFIIGVIQFYCYYAISTFLINNGLVFGLILGTFQWSRLRRIFRPAFLLIYINGLSWGITSLIIEFISRWVTSYGIWGSTILISNISNPFDFLWSTFLSPSFPIIIGGCLYGLVTVFIFGGLVKLYKLFYYFHIMRIQKKQFPEFKKKLSLGLFGAGIVAILIIVLMVIQSVRKAIPLSTLPVINENNVSQIDLVRTLSRTKDITSDIVFSPDGSLMATGVCTKRLKYDCTDSEVYVWQVSDSSLIQRLHTPPPYNIGDAAFSPDGSIL